MTDELIFHVRKTTVEQISYNRADAIALLLEDDEYGNSPGAVFEDPEQGRAAWGELPDVDLAFYLAERLNDRLSECECTRTVTREIDEMGESGINRHQWTVNGWTGLESNVRWKAARNAELEYRGGLTSAELGRRRRAAVAALDDALASVYIYEGDTDTYGDPLPREIIAALGVVRAYQLSFKSTHEK